MAGFPHLYVEHFPTGEETKARFQVMCDSGDIVLYFRMRDGTMTPCCATTYEEGWPLPAHTFAGALELCPDFGESLVVGEDCLRITWQGPDGKHRLHVDHTSNGEMVRAVLVTGDDEPLHRFRRQYGRMVLDRLFQER